MTKDQQTNTAQTNRALPQGWREVRLGEVGEIVTGKTPPTKRSELFGSEYPFITPTDISDNIRFCEPRRFLSEVGKNYQKNLILPPNSICYTCIASIGKICLTKEYSFTNQQINSVIVNKEYYNLFIFYLLRFLTPDIKKIASGTTTGIINKTAFSNILISVPPLPTQKAIAKVLSAFDDKIELLREQNETLEQIGQTLFKEWFGKYSPLRPDDLPEGWRVEEITKVVNLRQGQYIKADLLSQKPTADHKYPVYGANGVRGYHKEYQYADSKVVFGCRGVCGLPKYTEEKFSITNTCMVFDNADSSLSTEYIYFWSKYVDFESVTSGSAQPQITLSSLNGLKIIISEKSVLEDFNKVVKPLFDKIKNNNLQIQTLTQTRDTLLPKLMKGEVLV